MSKKQNKLINLKKHRKIAELNDEINYCHERNHTLWQLVKKQQKIIFKLEKSLSLK